MGSEAVDQKPVKRQVTIVDYGMGNLRSVAQAFESLYADVTVTGRPEEIAKAERLVLPGVGAFGEGMKNLQRLGLVSALREQVFQKRVPFLGICLGMQLLAEESQEHGHHQGLGWIPAAVKPLSANGSGLKTLHIGWDAVTPTKPNALFAGMRRMPYFYFVHGYHLLCRDADAVCATSTYGSPFVSAVHRENIFGVQFHPEKSQEAGLGLLKNFLEWRPGAAFEPFAVEAENPGAYTPKIRLIPTLLYQNGRLTKTVQFRPAEGIRWDVGHPVKAPMVYDAQLTDELIFLDIHATLEGRGVEQLAEAVSHLAGAIFMPLTAGGGIRTVEEIRRLLAAGADKVAINSAAVLNPSLIRQAAAIFGNQCVVVSIDAKRMPNGSYQVFTHSGTRPTQRDPAEWARDAEAGGAGEILLTSIDRDGTLQGYDLDLVRTVADAVKIPVIASGGAGKLQDLVEVITQGHACASAAASIFHFRDISPMKAKAFMKGAGLPVRD